MLRQHPVVGVAKQGTPDLPPPVSVALREELYGSYLMKEWSLEACRSRLRLTHEQGPSRSPGYAHSTLNKSHLIRKKIALFAFKAPCILVRLAVASHSAHDVSLCFLLALHVLIFNRPLACVSTLRAALSNFNRRLPRLFMPLIASGFSLFCDWTK